VPVSAIALGVFFLNEILLTRHLIGMMVIGLGLLAIDGRILQLLARLRRG
jgi:drug/metabolite transporter (DMT)-like permease